MCTRATRACFVTVGLLVSLVAGSVSCANEWWAYDDHRYYTHSKAWVRFCSPWSSLSGIISWSIGAAGTMSFLVRALWGSAARSYVGACVTAIWASAAGMAGLWSAGLALDDRAPNDGVLMVIDLVLLHVGAALNLIPNDPSSAPEAAIGSSSQQTVHLLAADREPGAMRAQVGESAPATAQTPSQKGDRDVFYECYRGAGRRIVVATVVGLAWASVTCLTMVAAVRGCRSQFVMTSEGSGSRAAEYAEYCQLFANWRGIFSVDFLSFQIFILVVFALRRGRDRVNFWALWTVITAFFVIALAAFGVWMGGGRLDAAPLVLSFLIIGQLTGFPNAYSVYLRISSPDPAQTTANAAVIPPTGPPPNGLSDPNGIIDPNGRSDLPPISVQVRVVTTAPIVPALEHHPPEPSSPPLMVYGTPDRSLGHLPPHLYGDGSTGIAVEMT